MTKIVVLAHDPKWADIFKLEVKVLVSVLGNVLISAHHIGSTSSAAPRFRASMQSR